MGIQYCPLLVITRTQGECMKKNCAWWCEADECTKADGCDGWCAILDIAGSISNIDFKVSDDALDVIIHDD